MTNDRQYVCTDCIGDDGLQQFAESQLVSGFECSEECDYCGRSGTESIAIDVQELIGYIEQCIAREWTDPANELPWVGREGGYQGAVYEWEDVLECVELRTTNETLCEDICSSRLSTWCKANHLDPTLSEQFMLGWATFKKTVKQLRRYTFWTDSGNFQEGTNPFEYGPPPSQMLQTIGTAIKKHNLLLALPESTCIWRLREHEPDKRIANPEDLTPPPQEFATQPNRMSPAGIPMFYGAEDWDTCFEEVASNPNKLVTGGIFENLLPITVLDLSRLPNPPSYFTEEGHKRIAELTFLRLFRHDLSQVIPPDKKQHIEYVPTQVFTEFIRFELSKTLEQVIHGICYPSSITGRKCYVFFFEQAACLPPKNSQSLQFLQLAAESVRTTPSKKRTTLN